MSAINVPFNISADEKIVPLDRWGYPAYTVQIVSGAPVIEGTTARINRGETPTWVALNDQSGTPISGSIFARRVAGPEEVYTVSL